MRVHITGIMISRDVFTFLGLNGGFETRQLHTLAATCGLVIISIHVGMHWQMVMNVVTKRTGRTNKNAVLTIMMRFITVGIVLFGIKSSFDLDIGSKLFMQTTFSYWDFEEDSMHFFLAYLSIMGIYITGTYYLLVLINKIDKQ